MFNGESIREEGGFVGSGKREKEALVRLPRSEKGDLVRRKGGGLNGERERGAGRPEATYRQAKNETKMAKIKLKTLENITIFIYMTKIELEITYSNSKSGFYLSVLNVPS